MQVFVTKKLAGAMGIKPTPAVITDPLFSWTANWTNTFDDRKEDLIVMVNAANRFTVTIYGVKRNQFKDIEEKMKTAIRNTLLAMNLNPEAVDEYMHIAGDVEFAINQDRQLTAWVNRQGLDAALYIGSIINKSYNEIKYDDTLGSIISTGPVNTSKRVDDGFFPSEEMIKALSEITGMSAYEYRAFELLVTLDLEVYKAVRRVIVPSEIEFAKLHKLLQRLYKWRDCHIHEFTVFDSKGKRPAARLVMSKSDFEYDSEAIAEAGHRLAEFFPEYSRIVYTYDMGDNWEHDIELVRVIDEHNGESPFLLEATGQAPPEDVGGVGGFIDFREIMLNPSHPEYKETKEWVGYWTPELSEWETKPQVVHV